MKRFLLISFFATVFVFFAVAQDTQKEIILTDNLCDTLCKAVQEKSKQVGIDISFAITDADGLPRLYKRFGNALVLSITLVPKKAYTSAITQMATESLAELVIDGAALQGINTTDPRITVVTGGFPLFYKGKIIGAIGVGGGTENQDREIGKYVIKIFEKLIENK